VRPLRRQHPMNADMTLVRNEHGILQSIRRSIETSHLTVKC
jgi:hypothetical protein